MLSGSPLFSIITVTLNCAADAKLTAESVVAQDFNDYEYVIKDGGSTDDTVATLQALDPMILVSEPDAGTYDAMNRSLSLCQGKYICFLNAGDIFVDDNVLKKVEAYIREYPEVMFFYGDVLTMRDHPVYGTGDKGEGRPLIFPDKFSRLSVFLSSTCHQSWFVHRDLYRERPLDTCFRLKADHDFFHFWILERQTSYQHIPEILIKYAAGGQTDVQRKLLRQEHRRLLKRYYSPPERLLFGIWQRFRQVYRVVNFYVRGIRPTN